MDEQKAREYVARNHTAVLATIKRDGRPQLSNVAYYLDDDGTLKVSVTKDRAKTKNLLRDPRVSMLCLDLSNWYSYAVVEGSTEFIDDERTLPELRRYYKRVRGEDHPNWQEYDEAMVRDRRVVLVVKPAKFYGMVR
ncbi:MAG TPA: PPOX class F420-dependent oxidoreductase [Chloroflexota bacterium]|jgi:PPOX class probable F420-dependent enzyme|nr:PPOX class F420-dependent oxidoreductase [Chloroflexota bacterium]